MKKSFVAVPAVVLASVLLLAGCSSSSTPTADATDTATSTAKPTADATDTPAVDPEEIGIELDLVEGVPGDPAAVTIANPGAEGSTEVTFTGTAENVLTLQEGFEKAGYTWNDLSGTGVNVVATNEEFTVLISAMDGDIYTYTIFKNE